MIEFLKNLDPASVPEPGSALYEEILHKSTILNVNEGSQFFFPGRVQDFIYFVRSGIVRSYALKNGKETTRWFFSKGDIVFSARSFFYDQPSDIYLQAMRSSVILEISKTNYFGLCKENSFFNEIAKKLEANYIDRYEVHHDLIKSHSALERYTNFIEQNPYLNLHVPIAHIANFLGMNPDTLTKTRKKYQQKNQSLNNHTTR